MLIDLPASTTNSSSAQYPGQTPPPSSAPASSQASSSDPPQNPTSTGIPGDPTSSPSTSLVHATNTGDSTATDTGNPLSNKPLPSNGLTESNVIALGVGIGVGLPATIASIVSACYGWKAYKRRQRESTRPTDRRPEANLKARITL